MRRAYYVALPLGGWQAIEICAPALLPEVAAGQGDLMQLKVILNNIDHCALYAYIGVRWIFILNA
jgi:hypothetical protein